MAKRNRRRERKAEQDDQEQQAAPAGGVVTEVRAEDPNHPDPTVAEAKAAGEAEASENGQDKAKPAAKAKKEKPLRPCLCGCGNLTKGTWSAGHDAKLDGVAHRVASGKLTPEAGEEALAGYPQAALDARKERLNAVAGLVLVK